MINFKSEISNKIAKTTNLNEKELETYIEEPKDSKNGDYAFPCFRLAKELKKAPPQIASEIKEKIEIDENVIEKVEIAGGYLNFYVNKELLAKEVINGKWGNGDARIKALAKAGYDSDTSLDALIYRGKYSI